MFFKILKYHTLCNIKQKDNFFWTLCFPLILATFFSMAFGDLGKQDKMKAIPIAVIETQDSSEQSKVLDNISILDIRTKSQDKADSLLKKGDIDAIVYFNGKNTSLEVTDSDFNQTIVKSIIDQIMKTNCIVTDIMTSNGGRINPDNLIADLNNPESNTVENKDAGKNNDQYAIFFFALIAMAILFAISTGVYSIINLQGNQSPLGARQCLSPTKKVSIYGIYVLCDLFTQSLACVILLFYIKYILRFNIGTINGWMILLVIVSAFASICLGTFISSVCTASESIKGSIGSSVSLVSSGLAGLYSNQVKGIVESKMPAIKYINPATLISDGFISLYYYNSISKYLVSVYILAGIGLLLFALTCLVLRRQSYASI